MALNILPPTNFFEEFSGAVADFICSPEISFNGTLKFNDDFSSNVGQALLDWSFDMYVVTKKTPLEIDIETDFYNTVKNAMDQAIAIYGRNGKERIAAFVSGAIFSEYGFPEKN